MKARARKHHVSLRPHVKTHKTVEIARMQVPEETSGITVSTLAEAQFYQKAGFEDITYAFPITPNKIPEAADLEKVARLFRRRRLTLNRAETAAVPKGLNLGEG